MLFVYVFISLWKCFLVFVICALCEDEKLEEEKKQLFMLHILKFLHINGSEAVKLKYNYSKRELLR